MGDGQSRVLTAVAVVLIANPIAGTPLHGLGHAAVGHAKLEDSCSVGFQANRKGWREHCQQELRQKGAEESELT
ncbi:MAG: hypothetical protein JKY65_00745 [Planctomycetes bacterium]|nr:hypothetical protein [Planctomycetota bacterium]